MDRYEGYRYFQLFLKHLPLLWAFRNYMHYNVCRNSSVAKMNWIYLYFTNPKQNESGEYYIQCPGRNVPDFGRMFLKLKYTDITQNTYIQIIYVEDSQ